MRDDAMELGYYWYPEPDFDKPLDEETVDLIYRILIGLAEEGYFGEENSAFLLTLNPDYIKFVIRKGFGSMTAALHIVNHKDHYRQKQRYIEKAIERPRLEPPKPA